MSAALVLVLAGAAQEPPTWARLDAQRAAFVQRGASADPAQAAARAAAARELADAALRALAEQDPWDAEQTRIGWECGVALAEAGLFEPAADVQRALHERLHATWTVLNLALTLTRAGAYEEADRELQRQAERDGADEAARAALVYQRALVALGGGSERRARDFLGTALALGSPDAPIVLAWLQLTAGRAGSARALLRYALTDESPGNAAWALRGWGLTLLPTSWATTTYNLPPDPAGSR